MSTSNMFLTYLIPMASAYIAYSSYKLNKEQIEENEKNFHINEVKKVFPCIISQKSFLNEIKIYNKSDYPIFDIVIVQGIDTMNLSKGETSSSAEYIRTILPEEEIVLNMENKGLGMGKFLVVGIFFRDYLGKEWFKDSYGRFKEVQNYKKMLEQKKILFSPYSETRHKEY